jgi:indolepyruvate ferredoxin oxidoreductase
LIDRRVADLIAYQDRAYAERYIATIERVRAATQAMGTLGSDMLCAVAMNAYKLMAYKDEYEVARLYAEPAFRKTLAAQFAATKRVSIWLAPPIISRTDPRTGRPAKRKFGPWVFTAFAALALMKSLRGSWADPFGRTHERRAERSLRDEYLATIDALSAGLDEAGLAHATALARLPDMVRGYGPVKEQAMAEYRAKRAVLLAKVETATERCSHVSEAA